MHFTQQNRCIIHFCIFILIKNAKPMNETLQRKNVWLQMRLEGFLNSNFNERVGLSVCGAPDTSAIRNALSACVLSIVRLAMSINSRLHCFYGKTTQATGSTILSHLPAAPVLSQRKSDVTLSVANHKVNQAQ